MRIKIFNTILWILKEDIGINKAVIKMDYLKRITWLSTMEEKRKHWWMWASDLVWSGTKDHWSTQFSHPAHISQNTKTLTTSKRVLREIITNAPIEKVVVLENKLVKR